MFLGQTENPKLRKDKIELVLKPIDNKKPLDSYGMTDPGMFSGKNKLWCIRNTNNNLYSFKYEYGGIPAPLKQQFTNFSKAYDAAVNYFKKRNIQIVDVLD